MLNLILNLIYLEKYIHWKQNRYRVIHREIRCRYKYSWILVEEDGLLRCKLVKPSYLNLNLFKPDIKKYLLTRKPNLIYNKDFKKKVDPKNILIRVLLQPFVI